MGLIPILILAIVQGAAELLPVSSSAHVIVAGRLLGFDVGSPEFMFVLVMLHTGTMGAVIVYFYSRWKAILTGAPAERNRFIAFVVLATAVTGVVGLALKHVIEHDFMGGGEGAAFENLARDPRLVAGALFAAGLLILFSARREKKLTAKMPMSYSGSFIVGFMQGLCVPFRGFSRSGSTISTGLILGYPRRMAEEFSFALAVVLTPAAIGLELRRMLKQSGPRGLDYSAFVPGLGGMVLSFVAGWLALKLLSDWIDKGRWAYFGYYCIAFAALVLVLR